MPARAARSLERGVAAADLGDDVRALVALAVRVTRQPDQVTPAEVAATVRAARSPADYLDAVGVIIGFNFITRVANALGVEPELGPWIRRVRAVRDLALRLGAVVLRGLVDLRPRTPAHRPAAANLLSLEGFFTDLGLGPLPEPIRCLREAPHLLETQRELFDALVSGRERERFLAVGLMVADELGLPALRERVARARDAAGGSGPAAVIPRFARQVTSRAYAVTRKRVDELRAAGLGDADILDLVSGIALWNAFVRLEILLAGFPNLGSAGRCASPEAPAAAAPAPSPTSSPGP